MSNTYPQSSTSKDRTLNGGFNGDGPVVAVQPPRREDLQPSYAKVLQPDTEDENMHGWYGNMINTLGSCVGTLGAIPCCIVCPNPYKPVEQGNVGLVTRFGRFSRAVDPVCRLTNVEIG